MQRRHWAWLLTLVPLAAPAADAAVGKASYFEVLGKPAYADCARYSGHARLAAMCEAARSHREAYLQALARGAPPAELERIYASHQQAVEYLVGLTP